MKHLFILALLLTLAACGSGTKPAPAADDGYPLKTCPVSGRELGSMGDPYVIFYHEKKVKLCCSSCLKEFNTDPAKYIQLLDEAAKKAQDAPAAPR